MPRKKQLNPNRVDNEMGDVGQLDKNVHETLSNRRKSDIAPILNCARTDTSCVRPCSSTMSSAPGSASSVLEPLDLSGKPELPAKIPASREVDDCKTMILPFSTIDDSPLDLSCKMGHSKMDLPKTLVPQTYSNAVDNPLIILSTNSHLSKLMTMSEEVKSSVTPEKSPKFHSSSRHFTGSVSDNWACVGGGKTLSEYKHRRPSHRQMNSTSPDEIALPQSCSSRSQRDTSHLNTKSKTKSKFQHDTNKPIKNRSFNHSPSDNSESDLFLRNRSSKSISRKQNSPSVMLKPCFNPIPQSEIDTGVVDTSSLDRLSSLVSKVGLSRSGSGKSAGAILSASTSSSALTGSKNDLISNDHLLPTSTDPGDLLVTSTDCHSQNLASLFESPTSPLTAGGNGGVPFQELWWRYVKKEENAEMRRMNEAKQIFTCLQCQASFQTMEQLVKHMEITKHFDNVPKSYSWSLQYARQRMRQMRVKMKYSDRMMYFCHLCQSAFSEAVQTHFSSVHSMHNPVQNMIYVQVISLNGTSMDTEGGNASECGSQNVAGSISGGSGSTSPDMSGQIGGAAGEQLLCMTSPKAGVIVNGDSSPLKASTSRGVSGSFIDYVAALKQSLAPSATVSGDLNSELTSPQSSTVGSESANTDVSLSTRLSSNFDLSSLNDFVHKTFALATSSTSDYADLQSACGTKPAKSFSQNESSVPPTARNKKHSTKAQLGMDSRCSSAESKQSATSINNRKRSASSLTPKQGGSNTKNLSNKSNVKKSKTREETTITSPRAYQSEANSGFSNDETLFASSWLTTGKKKGVNRSAPSSNSDSYYPPLNSIFSLPVPGSFGTSCSNPLLAHYAPFLAQFAPPILPPFSFALPSIAGTSIKPEFSSHASMSPVDADSCRQRENSGGDRKLCKSASLRSDGESDRSTSSFSEDFGKSNVFETPIPATTRASLISKIAFGNSSASLLDDNATSFNSSNLIESNPMNRSYTDRLLMKMEELVSNNTDNHISSSAKMSKRRKNHISSTSQITPKLSAIAEKTIVHDEVRPDVNVADEQTLTFANEIKSEIDVGVDCNSSHEKVALSDNNDSIDFPICHSSGQINSENVLDPCNAEAALQFDSVTENSPIDKSEMKSIQEHGSSTPSATFEMSVDTTEDTVCIKRELAEQSDQSGSPSPVSVNPLLCLQHMAGQTAV